MGIIIYAGSKVNADLSYVYTHQQSPLSYFYLYLLLKGANFYQLKYLSEVFPVCPMPTLRLADISISVQATVPVINIRP